MRTIQIITRCVMRTALIGAALLGFLVAGVTVTPIDRIWARFLAGPWDDPKGSVLIVLAGSALEHGVIGGSSYWRGVYAARAYREDGFREVVIAGGPPLEPASIPMREFLMFQGVPAEAIRVEVRSKSTRENALFVRELLKDEPGVKVLLTSDYHMYRAYRTFRKAGVNVQPRPFPDAIKHAGAWTERWPVFVQLCEEACKTAYYRFRGWI